MIPASLGRRVPRILPVLRDPQVPGGPADHEARVASEVRVLLAAHARGPHFSNATTRSVTFSSRLLSLVVPSDFPLGDCAEDVGDQLARRSAGVDPLGNTEQHGARLAKPLDEAGQVNDRSTELIALRDDNTPALAGLNTRHICVRPGRSRREPG